MWSVLGLHMVSYICQSDFPHIIMAEFDCITRSYNCHFVFLFVPVDVPCHVRLSLHVNVRVKRRNSTHSCSCRWPGRCQYAWLSCVGFEGDVYIDVDEEVDVDVDVRIDVDDRSSCICNFR